MVSFGCAILLLMFWSWDIIRTKRFLIIISDLFTSSFLIEGLEKCILGQCPYMKNGGNKKKNEFEDIGKYCQIVVFSQDFKLHGREQHVIFHELMEL